MGTRLSPHFAYLFLAERVITNKDPLDHILIVMHHPDKGFYKCFAILNTHDPVIKRRVRFGNICIFFYVFKENQFQNSRTLNYKLFFKLTDSNEFFHPKSFHPAHAFKGIVKFIRLHRSFSDKQNFNQA